MAVPLQTLAGGGMRGSDRRCPDRLNLPRVLPRHAGSAHLDQRPGASGRFTPTKSLRRPEVFTLLAGGRRLSAGGNEWEVRGRMVGGSRDPACGHCRRGAPPRTSAPDLVIVPLSSLELGPSSSLSCAVTRPYLQVGGEAPDGTGLFAPGGRVFAPVSRRVAPRPFSAGPAPVTRRVRPPPERSRLMPSKWPRSAGP